MRFPSFGDPPVADPTGAREELPELDSLRYPEESREEWGIALLLFTLSVLYLWPFRSISELHPDEGIVLQGAQRILGGQVLYRDFFSFYTPGSYYWLAFLFKMFGTSFLGARTLLPLYGGAFSAVIYLLARRVCSKWGSVLPAYLFLVIGLPYNFLVVHNWDSMLWAFLALYCAVRLLQTPHWGWALATGTFSALTFLFEQSKGGGLILGLVVGFLIVSLNKPRPAIFSRSYFAAHLVGLAWPLVVTLAFFVSQGSFSQMLADWFWPLQHYSGANRLPYGYINMSIEGWDALYGSGPWARRLLFILLTSPCFLLPVLPFVALALLGLHAFRLRRGRPANQASGYYVLVCAVALGLVLSAVATGRPEFDHLMYVAPPLVVVLGWVAGGRGVHSSLLDKVQPPLVAYLLILFTAFGMAYLVAGPLGAGQRLETRRGTLKLPRPDSVVPYLVGHVPPGDKIFVYPYQPLYYFLTDTYSPSSYDYLQLGMHTPEQMKQAINELAADQTKIVLYAPSFNSETIRRGWPATPAEVLVADPVRDFILSRYRPCTTLGSLYLRFVFMVRMDLQCSEATRGL